MIKNAFSGVLTALLLVSMVILAFNVQPAEAVAQTVYINADGSITPLGVPVVTSDQVTYTFTGNISYPTYSGIILLRNNIIIDGKGYTVHGGGRGIGLDLTGMNHVTIKNTDVDGFYTGIYLSSSSNDNISGNNITNNSIEAIELYYSSHNTISGNTFTNNGLDVLYSYQNSVKDNTVNGKPLVYLEDVANYSVSNAGQVILVKCDSIKVENLNLSRTTVGILLWETNNSIISGNDITNNVAESEDVGIYLGSSFNNSIAGNKITNNSDGIWLYSSSVNRISGNNITSNGIGGNGGGIVLTSSNNSISGNNIKYNIYGIILSSSGNSIRGNNITNNGIGGNGGGIMLSVASGNSISGNNIADNVYGIVLYSSSANNINGNYITNNGNGIRLDSSSDNGISGNSIPNNGNGIVVVSSSHNSISGNDIRNNFNGIWLDSSSSNKIYNNNFINNPSQVLDYSLSINVWDNGYPSGGNYWSSYMSVDSKSGPYQNQTGSDDIGDTPYIIDANNTDHYPLMALFKTFGAGTSITLTLRPSSIKIGASTTITAKLADDNKNALQNQTIDFTIGTTFLGSASTDSSGNAIKTYSATVDAGTYAIKASYRGSADHGSSTATSNLLVEALDTTVTMDVASATQGKECTLIATVKDEGGNPLQNMDVGFYIFEANTWTKIGSATTDSNGVAALTYTPSGLGTFQIKAMFNGTTNYAQSSSISGSLSVAMDYTLYYIGGAIIAIAIIGAVGYMVFHRRKKATPPQK